MEVAAGALHCAAAQLVGETGNGGGRHCPTFHSTKASACFAHRSLSGAGDDVHFLHNGASQAPLFLFGIFQSQRRVTRLSQRQRWVRVQTMPVPPSGRVKGVQVMLDPGRRRPACHTGVPDPDYP